MNCEPLKRVLMRRPMFCVCDRSSAASTSSKMYIGAGLNCRSAMMSERATSDLLVIVISNYIDEIGIKELTVGHRSTPSGSASTPCRGRP